MGQASHMKAPVKRIDIWLLLGTVAVERLDLGWLRFLSPNLVPIAIEHILLFLNGFRDLIVIHDRLEGVLLLQPGQLAVGILLVPARLSCVDDVRRDVSERPILLLLPLRFQLFHELER